MVTNPLFAGLRHKIAQDRLDNMVGLKGEIGLKEAETNFTNYSMHVFDRAIFFTQIQRDFQKAGQEIGFDECDMANLMAATETVKMAYIHAADSVLKCTEDYTPRNIRAYKINKEWQKIKRIFRF